MFSFLRKDRGCFSFAGVAPLGRTCEAEANAWQSDYLFVCFFPESARGPRHQVTRPGPLPASRPQTKPILVAWVASRAPLMEVAWQLALPSDDASPAIALPGGPQEASIPHRGKGTCASKRVRCVASWIGGRCILDRRPCMACMGTHLPVWHRQTSARNIGAQVILELWMESVPQSRAVALRICFMRSTCDAIGVPVLIARRARWMGPASRTPTVF